MSYCDGDDDDEECLPKKFLNKLVFKSYMGQAILRSTGTESVYVTFPYPCTGTEIVRMTGKVEKHVDGYGLISILWYGNGYGYWSNFQKIGTYNVLVKIKGYSAVRERKIYGICTDFSKI